MISESSLERKCNKIAKEKGILNYKLGQQGVPDRLYVGQDLVFFVEFKVKGAKPRLLQEVRIEELKSKNMKVFVVDELEQFIKILGGLTS